MTSMTTKKTEARVHKHAKQPLLDLAACITLRAHIIIPWCREHPRRHALPAARANNLDDVGMWRQRLHDRDLVLDELDLLGVAPVEDHALHSKLLLRAVWLPLVHPPNSRVSAFTELFADCKCPSLGAALEGQHAGTHMAPAEGCTALERGGLL